MHHGGEANSYRLSQSCCSQKIAGRCNRLGGGGQYFGVGGCWHSHPPLCSGCCVLCPLIASAYPQAPVGVVVGTATISPLALFPNVAFGYQHERVGLIVMDKQICLRAQFAHARLGWLVLSGILVLIPFPLIEGIVLDLFMLTMIY